MADDAVAVTIKTPIQSKISSTLSVGAWRAYQGFADVSHVSRWLPFAHRARVFACGHDGYASSIAFVRELERRWLGFTLEYSYDPATYRIRWDSETPTVTLSGEARFFPLSARACMMNYSITIDLPMMDEVLADELSHPASFVVAEFREHLRRIDSPLFFAASMVDPQTWRSHT